MQDKVSALPLILGLFDKQTAPASTDTELVASYTSFIGIAESKFNFMTSSPSILPKEVQRLT